ncbi:hypothetical protein GGTG_12431 [Gaeumannomyces tritici R3-111a-1]|uniref:F-box domain-containing protein n=1 Tax=Gaeumannomyces tritici (strain R3-111a-1) TaxID=644352 RepID=J3PG05_GAET3|nr:hypothetical protein GGTG_12431 [Gaeumannomyces tritici R3-111a-1]EJT70258.1 hypothetical protein GGTG_12431 [Gaeumannomyces tritici R3-111a-1]
MPSISDLPAEIIIKISRSLTTQDLGNLRLASKRTEAATFLPFAREFFFKKQFMLTEPSLQTLIDIAEHPQLGPQLSHLVLGLDGFAENNPLSWNFNVEGTQDQVAELTTRHSAQICLLQSGEAREMLAHALQRLPGLQTIGIRDFCSNTRNRDRGAWRSYGSVAAQNATGLPMDMRAHAGPTATAVFPIVIRALASAQRTGVDLEVILRTTGEGLTDNAFALSSFTRHQTLPVVKSLRKLHLDVRLITPHTMSFHDGADSQDNHLDSWLLKSHLQSFLSQASSLEWLRLNMKHGWENPEKPRLLLSWIALPLSKPVPVPGHFVAALKRLDLGDVWASRALYWAVINKFKDTLEALSLWNTKITISAAQYEDRLDQWTQLFKQLAGLPHLKEVTLGRLRVFPDYPTLDCRRGPQLGLGAGGDGPETHYRGKGAADFLQQLANHAQLDWDPLKPRATHAGTMEDDEDDNDSDEGSSEFNASGDDDAMDEDA